ncbi:C1q domain protein [compost metagenome]
MIYDGAAIDQLGEYNPSTGIFTFKQQGAYLVTASLSLILQTANSDPRISIQVPGGYQIIIAHQRTPATGYHTLTGARTIRLNAGDQIAIYVRGDAEMLTSPDGFYSWVDVIRIG